MEGGSERSFDLASAELRRDSSEVGAFVEALATKLETALPELCDVKRRRTGLFTRNGSVACLAIRLGEKTFVLERHGAKLSTTIESRVHDMRTSVQQAPMKGWLQALHDALERQSAASAETL